MGKRGRIGFINGKISGEFMKRLTNCQGIPIKCLECEEKDDCEYWCQVYDECAKKLKEYEDLEEQGLLVRTPCKIQDTVYCIHKKYTKCSENNQEFDECSCQGCERLECDSHKEYYVQSQKVYSFDWIVSNLNNFGKTVFISYAEAEEKLKQLSK